MARGTPRQRLSNLRKYMDSLVDEAVFNGSIIPVDTHSVKGNDCSPPVPTPAGACFISTAVAG
jgi:hypothetical protein